MKEEHPHETNLSASELQLIKQLREHPELRERFQQILEITGNAEGPSKRADEVEAVLIEEMRRLGKLSMQSWAERVEKATAEKVKQKDCLAVVRKKKR